MFEQFKGYEFNYIIKRHKKMTRKQYREMIKTKCDELAFKYLMNKRRTKGKEIDYTRIQMSDYLLPNNQLEIEDQKQIFELRNKMTNIRTNSSSNTKTGTRLISIVSKLIKL